MLLGGIDFLKFSWLLLYLDMSLLYAIGIMKSLTTATEMTCIQIEITLLFLLCGVQCQRLFLDRRTQYTLLRLYPTAGTTRGLMSREL